jgi:DnaJ like chaperone protein
LSWWGTLLGGAFGYMVGGPLGGLLGAVLGRNLDKGMQGLTGGELPEPGARERVQTAFFTATFSVMGHVAKADGRVSEDEIAMARAVMDQMDLGHQLRQTAIRLFNEGKRPGFPLDQVLEQFRRECHRRQTLLRMFLEIQLQAAYADGRFDPAEERLLLHICLRLGFDESLLRHLEARIRAERGQAGAGRPSGPTLEEAYAILNISPGSSEAEVKKAYRRLLSQHHPDKLVSRGLPEEMMKIAAQKTHEIRQAYELIKAERGF